MTSAQVTETEGRRELADEQTHKCRGYFSVSCSRQDVARGVEFAITQAIASRSKLGMQRGNCSARYVFRTNPTVYGRQLETYQDIQGNGGLEHC